MLSGNIINGKQRGMVIMIVNHLEAEFDNRLAVNEMLSDFWQKAKDSKTMEEYQAHLNETAKKLDRYSKYLGDKVTALERERGGEVWYWLGDGNDHPENLCCPILIEPEDLNKLLSQIPK